MYVRCPECQTLYHITAGQLGQAEGEVECGRCGATFSALGELFDTLTEARAALAPAGPESETGPESEPDIDEQAMDAIEAESSHRTVPAPVDLSGVTETRDPAAIAAASKARQAPVDVSAVLLDEAPRRKDDKAETISPRRWLLVLGLLVLLLVQGVYFYRLDLLRDPTFGPVVRSFCDTLGCELPLPRILDRIEVTERDVRMHPRVKDALLVSAILVNQAPVPQAYPLIELRMSDINGAQTAGRWFQPQEYLAYETDLEAGMPPGEPVHLMLEVVDPGSEVVSFQFNFR